MPPVLLVNPRAGVARPSAGELQAEAERLGIRVRVLRPGDDVSDVARSAGADALGVAGGDGSLAPVAAVALEQDVPFVCVPFGTRNHFARDLGLDRDDPMGALAAFRGRERRIDVGRVDGRLFLNNVSLGAYAHLVHRRERHRRRRQALAAARALLLASRRGRLRARIDGDPVDARVLLVANNAYRLDLFSLGERERLDEGLLHLYAARGLLPLTWEDEAATAFTIEVAGERVRAAADGEPLELESPVRLEIVPGTLRVLVPDRRQ